MTLGWTLEATFPPLSLSCDYLMHAVLSISALHFAFLHPDQRDKYNYISAQHQDMALGPFQQAISNINAENCHYVFAFSALLLISIYSSSRNVNFLSSVPEVASGLTGLTNWITCLQGCRFIVAAASPQIRSGPFRNLIVTGAMAEHLTIAASTPLQDEDSQSLNKLARFLTDSTSIKSTTTVAEMEAYSEAIALLQKCLTATTQVSDSQSLRSLMSVWPAKISNIFIRLLDEKRPPALAIIAHFCLLLKRCGDCWYLKHRSYDIFKAVRQSLPEDWMPSIERPLRVFGKE